MNWFGIILNIIGIGKDALKRKQERNKQRDESKQKIEEAITEAKVTRILSNNEADNSIDIITAENKKYTLKDEVVTYLFLVPVVIATITPFLISSSTGEWLTLSENIEQSYKNLDNLPTWYKWVVGLIVIDVLGFRSFARKVIDKYLTRHL